MDIQQYQELESRRLAAYSAFSRIYEVEYPQPVKPAREVRRDWFFRVLIFIGLIASMWVSASHTIPVFSRHKSTDVGIAAFFMLETMLVSFGFYVYIAKERFRIAQGEEQRGQAQRHILAYMGRGITIAFAVACMAQLQDVLSDAGYGENIFGVLWTVSSVSIEIGKALAAPMMILITGHALAMLYVQDMNNDNKADKEYEKLISDWQQEKIRIWKTQQARYDASVHISRTDSGRTTDIAMPILSVRTADGQRTDSGHSYERKSNAKEIVRQWLNEHPEDISAQVRDLADRLSVGKTTVSDVQREMKGKVS